MARLVRDGTSPSAEEFRSEVLLAHRRLTALRGAGRWQLPWPRAIGTPPWAVARELERITGCEHDVVLARWSCAAAYDRLAITGGALYVGSRTLPRHVLLVMAPAHPGEQDALRSYEPSRGTVVRLAREDFVPGRLRGAGWYYPWFAISATGARGSGGPPVSPPVPR